MPLEVVSIYTTYKNVWILACDEDDCKGECDDSLTLEDLFWHEWELMRTPSLPDRKGYNHDEPDNEWTQDLATDPWILIASSLEAHEKHRHATNR